MHRILIVDDHAVVRAGLRQILLDDQSIGEVDEAATGEQALDKLRQGKWDLLILDINMPGRNGIDILRNVVAGHPDTRILVLSGYP